VPLSSLQIAALAVLAVAHDPESEVAGWMPTDRLGRWFLDGTGAVVEQNPARLDAYVRHSGERRGHWPTSPEIRRAMFDRMLGSEG